MYKPLPESVTIKASGIHDLGLFADQAINQATNLGITHIKIDDTISAHLSEGLSIIPILRTVLKLN